MRLCRLIIEAVLLIRPLLSAASHVAEPLEQHISFTGHLRISDRVHDLTQKGVYALNITIGDIVCHTLNTAFPVSRNVTVSIGIVIVHERLNVTGKHIGTIIILLITASL